MPILELTPSPSPRLIKWKSYSFQIKVVFCLALLGFAVLLLMPHFPHTDMFVPAATDFPTTSRHVEPSAPASMLATSITTGEPTTLAGHRSFKHHLGPEAEYRKARLYAVISCSLPTHNFRYAMVLPLTVRAWRRLGVTVLVILTGSETEWRETAERRLVLKEVLHLDGRLRFMPLLERAAHAQLSQASRVFAARLFALSEDDVIVTSDVDMWVLQDRFKLEPGRKLHLVNYRCCGYFRFRAKDIRMQPISYVVASVAVWRQMIQEVNLEPDPSAKIVQLLIDTFGRGAASNIIKSANNPYWFMDQHLLSILLTRYREKLDAALTLGQLHDATASHKQITTATKLESAAHNWFQITDNLPTGLHRININNALCTSSRFRSTSIADVFDVHVVKDLREPRIWQCVLVTLRQMYEQNELDEVLHYRSSMLRLLDERNVTAS